MPKKPRSVTTAPGARTTAISDAAVTAVDYENLVEVGLEHAGDDDSAVESAELLVLEPLPPVTGLTIDELEELALLANPSIAQAQAAVCALRGKWVQVGLPPNPRVGYLASEIGNQGRAGQQGAFVGQTFITGNKLEWSQAVVAAEIRTAQQQLAAAQRRVRTDVRKGYYEALLAQRRLELADELVRLTSAAAQVSKLRVQAAEIPLTELLQAELQEQNALVLLRTSENRHAQAWRTLSAVIGTVELPVQPLVGDVTQLPESLDWQQQLTRLQSQSPEVSVAMVAVDRARRALCRARAEAVPDINTQLTIQYDAATQDTVTGIQIGLPLPIWNWNQGGIQQAKAGVTEAVRSADRVELDLSRRLASAYRAYADARVTAETYATEILPRAERTFQLVQKGYQQDEVAYLDSLVAQQTFSQTNLVYLDALGQLWKAYVEIDGLLLEDALATVPR